MVYGFGYISFVQFFKYYTKPYVSEIAILSILQITAHIMDELYL